MRGDLYGLVQEFAPDARSLRPDAPAALLGVVQRCMRKEPDERFQDARELKRALQAIQL